MLIVIKDCQTPLLRSQVTVMWELEITNFQEAPQGITMVTVGGHTGENPVLVASNSKHSLLGSPLALLFDGMPAPPLSSERTSDPKLRLFPVTFPDPSWEEFLILHLSLHGGQYVLLLKHLLCHIMAISVTLFE